jgi:hypothetical protein
MSTKGSARFYQANITSGNKECRREIGNIIISIILCQRTLNVKNLPRTALVIRSFTVVTICHPENKGNPQFNKNGENTVLA